MLRIIYDSRVTFSSFLWSCFTILTVAAWISVITNYTENLVRTVEQNDRKCTKLNGKKILPHILLTILEQSNTPGKGWFPKTLHCLHTSTLVIKHNASNTWLQKFNSVLYTEHTGTAPVNALCFKWLLLRCTTEIHYWKHTMQNYDPKIWFEKQLSFRIQTEKSPDWPLAAAQAQKSP